MRTFEFDPFWRTSVGFDRLFDLVDQTLRDQPSDDYPAYNIARTGEDTFRISVAVVGFRPDQVSVTAHQNTLIVAGRTSEDKPKTEYLYRGIAGTPFERRFNLADFVEAKDAWFEDGMLHIDLERRIPEAMKPRQIEVKTAAPSDTRTIEQKVA